MIIIIWEFIDGSLEVKLATIWTDENRDGKIQRREENRKSQKKGAPRGSKVANRFLPVLCGNGYGSKSRLANHYTTLSHHTCSCKYTNVGVAMS